MAKKTFNIQDLYDKLLLIQELINEIKNTSDELIQDTRIFGGEIERVLPVKIKSFLQDLIKISTDSSKDYSIVSLIKFLDSLPLSSIRNIPDEKNIFDLNLDDNYNEFEGDEFVSQTDQLNPEYNQSQIENLENSEEMKNVMESIRMKEKIMKNLLNKNKLNFEKIKENLEPIDDGIFKAIYGSDDVVNSASLISKVKREMQEKEELKEQTKFNPIKNPNVSLKDWRELALKDKDGVDLGI